MTIASFGYYLLHYLAARSIFDLLRHAGVPVGAILVVVLGAWLLLRLVDRGGYRRQGAFSRASHALRGRRAR